MYSCGQYCQWFEANAFHIPVFLSLFPFPLFRSCSSSFYMFCCFFLATISTKSSPFAMECLLFHYIYVIIFTAYTRAHMFSSLSLCLSSSSTTQLNVTFSNNQLKISLPKSRANLPCCPQFFFRKEIFVAAALLTIFNIVQLKFFVAGFYDGLYGFLTLFFVCLFWSGRFYWCREMFDIIADCKIMQMSHSFSCIEYEIVCTFPNR